MDRHDEPSEPVLRSTYLIYNRPDESCVSRYILENSQLIIIKNWSHLIAQEPIIRQDYEFRCNYNLLKLINKLYQIFNELLMNFVTKIIPIKYNTHKLAFFPRKQFYRAFNWIQILWRSKYTKVTRSQIRLIRWVIDGICF